METIAAAFIAGLLALIGVIITNLSNGKSIETKLVTAQEVTNTQISNIESRIVELKEEVHKHNNFAERIPVIERDVSQLKEDVKELKRHE